MSWVRNNRNSKLSPQNVIIQKWPCSCLHSLTGLAEHCTLCRSQQSNQATRVVPPVDRSHHGGILPPRRPGAGEGHGNQSHVWQTECLSWEVTGGYAKKIRMENGSPLSEMINLWNKISQIFTLIDIKSCFMKETIGNKDIFKMVWGREYLWFLSLNML